MKSCQGENNSRNPFSLRKWVSKKNQIVLILGLALAIVGYFGPWVDHRTAALVLTGQDMGEFVKFLPEVRAGTAPMVREFFYLPPFAAALGLILLLAGKRLAYPLPVRAVMVVVVLGLAWAILPPVWTPHLLVTAEFRKQTVAIVFCLLLLVVHPVLRPLPLRFMAVAMIGLALLGALPPLWQFFAIREAVNRAYGWSVQLGWGLGGTVLGFLTVMAGAVALFETDGH